MARFIKDRTSARGQAPGSLIFIGNKKMEAPLVQMMQYNSNDLNETESITIEQALNKINPDCVNWINVYGLHDVEMIKTLGDHFKIRSLLLEDILNTDQRPRYGDEEEFDLLLLKMLRYENRTKRIHAEQITIILGENYVLTLQERKGDVFSPVRERIRNKRGKIRNKSNDYLTYSLLDTIVDNYTILIENLGGKIEDLEDRLFRQNDDSIVEEIYAYKTELNFLRKNVRPVKDIMTALLKSENSYFREENTNYLKDLYELVVQSTETIELYHSLISDQLNIYNTNVSNRMNEVMKVLTIFASIFIPLTFIAGVYGMNFEHIPELKYKLAYPMFWLVSLVVLVVLLIYFKRKKWL